MRVEFKPQLFILAANGQEDKLIQLLKGDNIAFKEVQGMYKGVTERSFVVLDPGLDLEPAIRSLARMFNQESYLRVDPSRKSYLIYLESTKVEYIGSFDAADKHVTKNVDAYTYDPEFNQYYVVR
jgi:hypothetical protein